MHVCIRTFFLFLLWVIPCPVIHAQVPGAAASRVYLIQGKSSTDLNRQLPAGARILRQLGPETFIIATTDSGALAAITRSMVPATNDWKLSPALLALTGRRSVGENETVTLTVTVSDPESFKRHLRALEEYVTIVEEYVPGGILTLRCRYGNFTGHILPIPELVFADFGHGRPREEQAIDDIDLSANAILLAHEEYPEITGRGMVASIREDLFDSADIDLRGRVRPDPLASTFFSTHATIIATMIGGAGNSYHTGQGVATRATLTSFNFNSLLPDPDTIYRAEGISVQNHSYGSAIENYYGNEAAAHDLSAGNNPGLVHVFSAGNAGDQAATAGHYSGLGGWADLTGNYKMAKNILTVGSTDSFGRVLTLSSKGPAYDGRIKPELVAFGQDGSSGAAAIVSGTSLLLQEAYAKRHNGQIPPSDLVRAVLLNSTDDAGPPGIDFSSGYGQVNVCRALKIMQGGQFFIGSLPNGGEEHYTLPIPVNARNFRITLAWNDPAALPNAYTALVNDLDLELVGPNGRRWLPWVLNSAPDSLAALPLRRRDSLNNIEQISLDGSDLPAGDYILHVRGTAIRSGQQTYSLVYGWDPANVFKWAYPVGGAGIVPDAVNLLRWETNRQGPGVLEYSLDSGQHWTLIDAWNDLPQEYYRWQAPDTIATGMLRIRNGGDSLVSGLFPIGKALDLYVGYNCTDSFFLYWNSLRGVGRYQVYVLGEEALEPLASVKDSFLILDKTQHPSLYYAVAPLLPFGVSGMKSYTLNYTTQGTGCYVSSFTADRLEPSSALLTLILGTGYGVRHVGFEKWVAGGWLNLSVIESPDTLKLSVTDPRLVQGVNRYRVVITLMDGRVIDSEEEDVYFAGAARYLVYPNPGSRHGVVHILSADPGWDNAVLVIRDVTGRKIYEGRPVNNPEVVVTDRWAAGLYFFVILQGGQPVDRGKILIN